MATSELPEMPNGPILELYGQKKRFHVPHGLKPLLEEITTEVLRYQPEDIYVFLAQYIDAKILKTRGPRKSQTEIEPKEVLDVDEETEDLLGELQLKKSDADKYATKIQAAFRGHTTRRSLASKGRLPHKEHRKSWEWKKWGWEGPSELEEDEVEEMLDEFKVNKDDADKAATKIQAVFRGHRLRKSLEKQGKVIKVGGGQLQRDDADYEEEAGEDGAFELNFKAEVIPPEETAKTGEDIEQQSEAEETLQSNPEESSAAETEEGAPSVNEETEEETESELPTADGSARESTGGEDTSVFSDGEGNTGPIPDTTEEEDTENEA